VRTPRNEAERAGAARVCMTRLELPIPILVERFSNTVEKRYAAWPDRLYVVDRDGRVAYRSRPGPAGFRPLEMERALLSVVDAQEVSATVRTSGGRWG
jgi:hypothetical protein